MDTKATVHEEQCAVNDVEVLPPDTVVIAGGGPVGLFLASVLAFFSVKSVLFERNKTTTRFVHRAAEEDCH